MQLLKPAWINHDGDKAIFSVDIHPDGSRFATGGQGQDSSGRVVIWNLQPVVSEKAEHNEKLPKLLCQLDQHLGCVNSVRWSQSGRYLASAGDDKVIIIWQKSGFGGGAVFGSNVVNVESWRIVTTLRGHQGDILDVSWSPDDLCLASASVDNTIIIWNTSKWPDQVRVLKGHTGMVKGVTWDPVGRYLASQADDKSLRIWRTSSWVMEQKIIEPFTECGGTTTVLRSSWSPDGQYLVSAHAMNNGGPTAQIIERDGWNTDKDFVGHRKAITCVRFNPNILRKQDCKQSKPIQYCCVAIGSRDRSVSIWLTCLKRPLVVVHDIFEDSVLDLSWSRCGRLLMAVSKDGTLAFIHFNNIEIGNPLSADETVALHVKLYGNSAANSSAVTASIIENPELLKLQEEESRKNAIPKKTAVEEKKLVTPRGPTNKQIEMRTADGRRRITPMFIPPTLEGQSNSKSEEMSFSSSRQEKSKIIIEKLDGIVEPNVSSPSKLKKSPVSLDQVLFPMEVVTPSQPELESVPAGLSARIEGVTGALSSLSAKRKNEEQNTKKKRGRGRPLTYDRSESIVGSPTLTPTDVKQGTLPAISYQRHILSVATMSKSSRIQIPGTSKAGSPTPMLVIENNWKLSEKLNGNIAETLVALHRISRYEDGGIDWSIYLPSEVAVAVTTGIAAALACKDSTLHLLDIVSGEHILPPILLHGKPSQLFVQKLFIIALTTDATLSIWDLSQRKRVMLESIRHLVENRGSVKCVQLFGNDDKTPVVILTSGEAFTWYRDLEAWVQLSDSSAMRKYIGSEYSIVRPCHQMSQHSPLSGILMQSASYAGSSRLNVSSVISAEVRQGMTEAFLKRMLASCEHLSSASDYKFWLKKLIIFYIKEGMELKIRKIFDDLLGPVQSENSEATSKLACNSKVLELDKHKLLKEFLKEILLANNSIKFQRLHSEYLEQLKGTDSDSI